MTEDDVVEAIRELLERCGNENRFGRVRLGIGDDAAVWQPSRSHRSVITSDVLIDGVHFTRDSMSLEDAGWRAMVANISDLAAMGARPLLATVALGLTPTMVMDQIMELYRGLAAAAADSGVAIVGGDLSRSSVLSISIAAVGEVRPAHLKQRSGARVGDVLAVTGALGRARAGLEVARAPGLITGTLRESALRAFRRPEPRAAEGRFLAASRSVRAMIDCSDGLSTDLERLCAAGKHGAIVETVPVSDEARGVSRRLSEDPERFALAGGEDFELLVAVRARAYAYLESRFAARFGRPLLRVGVVRLEPGIVWNGETLQRSGWDHFRLGE